MTVKKRNTYLFLLGATVFNVVLTLALLIGGLVLINAILRATGAVPDVNAFNLLLLADLIVSIVLSSLAYRAILKALGKKFEFDQHFDPIFKPKDRLR
jgi:hypothetical protein